MAFVRKKFYFILINVILIILLINLHTSIADDKEVFGLWKSFNMKTKEPEAIVKIYKKDDKLYGKVLRLLPNRIKELEDLGEYPPICKKCPDEFKNKPIIGLNFIYGLEKEGNEWGGGKILDPETGKIYDVYISLDKKNPNILKIKGCIFKPLCKTQRWERINETITN